MKKIKIQRYEFPNACTGKETKLSFEETCDNRSYDTYIFFISKNLKTLASTAIYYHMHISMAISADNIDTT